MPHKPMDGVWDRFSQLSDQDIAAAQELRQQGIFSDEDGENLMQRERARPSEKDIRSEPPSYVQAGRDEPRQRKSRIEIQQKRAPGMPGGRTWSIRQIMDGAK